MPPVTSAMRLPMQDSCVVRCGMRSGRDMLHRGAWRAAVDASGLATLLRRVRIERAVAHAVRGGREESLLQRLPQVHVAFREVVQHRPRRLAEDVVELAAELLLLVEEHLQAALEVAAHEALQRITVETDDLRQQL